MYRISRYIIILALVVALFGLTSLNTRADTTTYGYTLPNPQSAPHAIITGPDGALWFTESVWANRIGRLTTGAKLTEYQIVPTGYPNPHLYLSGITAGPDGAIWFTGQSSSYEESGKIWRISLSGNLSSWSLPEGSRTPEDITVGPDGALWFTVRPYWVTEHMIGKIGRITTDGTITEFTLPADSNYPNNIITGPDGNLWFTMFDGKIGRMTTQGVTTIYTVPVKHPENHVLQGITVGPDGNIWFADAWVTAGVPDDDQFDQIGRITPDGQIVEFRLPVYEGTTGHTSGITFGPDGNIWFTGYSYIGKMTPSGDVTYFPVDGSAIIDITAGSDGALWFTNKWANSIGRITTTGTITEFPVQPGTQPTTVTPGNNGGIWFGGAGGTGMIPPGSSNPGTPPPSNTSSDNTYDIVVFGNGCVATMINGSVIAMRCPGDGYPVDSIRQTGEYTATFPLDPGSDAHHMTIGPDGNIWYAAYGSNRIGRVTTTGAISEFTLPNSNSGPLDITAGPDGALWFTEETGNRIGRITTGGTITEYTLPVAQSRPQQITTGPDGALWFTEKRGAIGRITAQGAIREYALPDPSSEPQGITAGPDGALWFTETAANKIGRITTTGLLSHYPIQTPNSKPVGIAAGPDGNIWFTQSATDQLGQLIPPPLYSAYLPLMQQHAGSGW